MGLEYIEREAETLQIVSRARLWEGVLVHVGVWAPHDSSKPRKKVTSGIGFA